MFLFLTISFTFGQTRWEAENTTNVDESFGNFTNTWGEQANAALSGGKGRKTGGVATPCATSTNQRGRYITIDNLGLGTGVYDITVAYYDGSTADNDSQLWFYIGPTATAGSISEPPTDPGGMDITDGWFCNQAATGVYTRSYTNVSLSRTGDAIYMFACPSGSNTNAFFDYVDFTTVSLPVEWLNFEGRKEKNQNILLWSTASEINNSYFIVERSLDGKTFISIGNVSGNGNSNSEKEYQFTDVENFNETVYYRLIQVDFDGQHNNSKIIAVGKDKGQNDITFNIYPSPNNGDFIIRFNRFRHEYMIDIADVIGRSVYQSSGTTTDGKVEVKDFTKGIYIVRLLVDNSVHVKKMIVD